MLHSLVKIHTEPRCIIVLFLSPPSLPVFQIYHSPITKQEESESFLLLFVLPKLSGGRRCVSLHAHGSHVLLTGLFSLHGSTAPSLIAVSDTEARLG